MAIDLEDLLSVLDDPQSVTDLRTYFHIGVPEEARPYTGRHFERLDGGGDRPEVKDRIGPIDLIAVQALSVKVPIEAAVKLLQGQLGDDVSEQLQHIPSNVDLGTNEATAEVGDSSPADKAWRLLIGAKGIGPVRAGKLLARKRPRLIPVWDDVVQCAYGEPEPNEWVWLDDLLRQDGGILRRRLAVLHDEAGLPVEISILRTLDVAIWMKHHKPHRAGDCPMEV